jgi:hypothetical protein
VGAEFILGRTSWNVCFASSFWGELHGMYVLGVHFGENFMECMFCEFILGRTSWNVCFASSFWGELHGMFCEFNLERTSWNVLLFEACMVY